jgi:membrane protease YdiL (CAAX protease family)
VLLVFAAFFAAGIVAGGETLAGRYPTQSGSWAVFGPAAISEITVAGVAVALTVQDDSYTLYATAASLAAGVVEETVVLAFVVSTLRQAGRPLIEVVAVAIALRMSYHDYYGPGVAGIAIWAAVFIWLYLRTGSIIPLIIVHFFWDATIFWTQRWHWVGVAAVYISIALIIAAAVSWWADRAGRGRQQSRGPTSATYTAWPFADPGQLDR